MNLSKIIVLNHIIEKFVNELNDKQFRYKMRYKYLITSNKYFVTFEWNFYEIYEIVEQISNYITNKKQTLKNEFEKKLTIVMQTQNMTIALKFVVKNQSKSFKKSKSIFVDSIERYRSKQHTKFENTMQKNIVKKISSTKFLLQSLFSF